jgi:hypothetical protein
VGVSTEMWWERTRNQSALLYQMSAEVGASSGDRKTSCVGHMEGVSCYTPPLPPSAEATAAGILALALLGRVMTVANSVALAWALALALLMSCKTCLSFSHTARTPGGMVWLLLGRNSLVLRFYSSLGTCRHCTVLCPLCWLWASRGPWSVATILRHISRIVYN